MSLNMYVGETGEQTTSMNAICTQIIQSMEQTQRSISSFMFAFGLKGKTYDSAKTFMAQTYYPLAQGIIYLCEELMEQNTAFPTDFTSQVAPIDVVEFEIVDQISEIDRIIADLRAASESVPLLSVSIFLYEKMKQMLELKVERLYAFNESSASNFETAVLLADEVAKGLRELNGGTGFNRMTGTFSTEGMDLDWATKLAEIHYGKKAEAKYAEYLAQFSDEEERADAKEKVIDILKYEDANPEYVEQTDEFLSPLDQEDVIDVKHLMYTADEPYRTLSMKYLDRFEIVILTEKIREEEQISANGVFRHSEDVIFLEMKELREDERGMFYTYFHEVAHAFDYYYAQDNEEMLQKMIKDDRHLEFNNSTFFTDVYKIDDNTLADCMYEDAGNNFQEVLGSELESSRYEHLSAKEKQEMVDHVTENLLVQNDLLDTLTKEELDLQKTIQRKYKSDLLEGPDHNTASDVYGGVTNRVIEGTYTHKKEEYWIYEDGTRNKEPNREGFAEYYGRIMSPGEGENHGVNSVEEYLSTSKEHMDEAFRYMGKE